MEVESEDQYTSCPVNSATIESVVPYLLLDRTIKSLTMNDNTNILKIEFDCRPGTVAISLTQLDQNHRRDERSSSTRLMFDTITTTAGNNHNPKFEEPDDLLLWMKDYTTTRRKFHVSLRHVRSKCEAASRKRAD